MLAVASTPLESSEARFDLLMAAEETPKAIGFQEGFGNVHAWDHGGSLCSWQGQQRTTAKATTESRTVRTKLNNLPTH